MISLTAIWLDREGYTHRRETLINPLHIVTAHEVSLHPREGDRITVTHLRMSVGTSITVTASLAHVHGLCLDLQRRH